jgi:hypothetical protein
MIKVLESRQPKMNRESSNDVKQEHGSCDVTTSNKSDECIQEKTTSKCDCECEYIVYKM